MAELCIKSAFQEADSRCLSEIDGHPKGGECPQNELVAELPTPRDRAGPMRTPPLAPPWHAVYTMARNCPVCTPSSLQLRCHFCPRNSALYPCCPPEPAALTVPLNSKMYPMRAPIPSVLASRDRLDKWVWLVEPRPSANSLAAKRAGKAGSLFSLRDQSVRGWKSSKHRRVVQGSTHPRQMSTTHRDPTSSLTCSLPLTGSGGC